MNSIISSELLYKLSVFVATHMGLHFPKERWRDLERGINCAAQDFGFTDAQTCIEYLLSSLLTKKQVEILACHLTIGETHFFREQESLNLLNNKILPDLIGLRRKEYKYLRIWSAACSTGEEPYTIAILLDKLIPDINDWHITITATDINSKSLQIASEGIYGEWSFRGTPQWVKDKYFENKKGKRFKISQKIKAMVNFSYLNLAEDIYPSLLNNTNGMDLIFCRNVLMYFTEDQVSKVLRQLNLSLVNGGWLVVSPVDITPSLSSRFMFIKFAGTSLYRKECYPPQITETPHTKPLAESQSSPSQIPENLTVSKIFSTSHLSDSFADSRSDINEENQILHDTLSASHKQRLLSDTEEKTRHSSPLSTDDSNSFEFLARENANQGRLSVALEWCEKAVAADKMNPALHYLLANILQEYGQLEEAALSLKRALYLDYDFVLAHFALGNLTRQQGRVKESKKHFQNALAILRCHGKEDILPESEGITAGRLIEVIESIPG